MSYVCTPKPMGDSVVGAGGGGKTLLSGDSSGDLYEDCKGLILHPLVMVLITKEGLRQLTLSYCSLFTLNKRNMT